jgi:hypothetical protein
MSACIIHILVYMHSVIYGLRKDEQIGEIDESDAV